ASPFTIINRHDNQRDIEAIIGVVTQKQVGRIIIGLPLSMNGSTGQQAEKVKTFTRELCDQTEVPVEFRDERLSTVSARRLMKTVKRAKKVSHDDAMAAAVILQSYLDETTP
ncbi:Holliday junction resolvase RuvX, partial [Chloroflexota bacterium]